MTTFPYGYGSGRCSMSELKAKFEPKMEPEYARRLFAWIESKGGAIGIGGGWRSTQPSKPGFAPDGKSFHQSQTFADGFVGYCAVDLVHVNGNAAHRAPTWSEVPAQGSSEAAKCGVHANVSGESWHLQPVEIDGWQSWSNAGRPRPKAGYKIPSSPEPEPEEDDMSVLLYAKDDDGTIWCGDGITRKSQKEWPVAMNRAKKAGMKCVDFVSGKDATSSNISHLDNDDMWQLGASQ